MKDLSYMGPGSIMDRRHAPRRQSPNGARCALASTSRKEERPTAGPTAAPIETCRGKVRVGLSQALIHTLQLISQHRALMKKLIPSRFAASPRQRSWTG